MSKQTNSPLKLKGKTTGWVRSQPSALHATQANKTWNSAWRLANQATKPNQEARCLSSPRLPHINSPRLPPWPTFFRGPHSSSSFSPSLPPPPPPPPAVFFTGVGGYHRRWIRLWQRSPSSSSDSRPLSSGAISPPAPVSSPSSRSTLSSSSLSFFLFLPYLIWKPPSFVGWVDGRCLSQRFLLF